MLKLSNPLDDGSLTDADTVAYFNHAAAKMMESDEIVKQAKAITRAQFRQSPTIPKVGRDASIAAMDNYGIMGQKLFKDSTNLEHFLGLLADHLDDKINDNGLSGGNYQ